MKEGLKLSIAIGAALIGLGLCLSLIIIKFKDKDSVKSKKVAVANFSNPEYKEGDCFLVSTEKTSLHPHYLRIVEKDFTKSQYAVLESIGNGQNKEVTLFLNYYDEMKSFDKYRSSCPQFMIK